MRHVTFSAGERKASRFGIAVEHLDGFDRQLIEITASEFDRFAKDVVRDRDNVGAGVIGLIDVDDFAYAGPKKLGGGKPTEELGRPLHHRHRVTACIRDPTRKD